MEILVSFLVSILHNLGMGRGVEIKRDSYLRKLISRAGDGQVKVLTGLRRSGKSYLLFRLFRDFLVSSGVKDDHIIALALDDLRNRKYWNPIDLDDYVRSRIMEDGEMTYVFIDEIQFARPVPNSYVDDAKVGFENAVLGWLGIPGVDVYVTGSNSRMLSSDIATEFRGRLDNIEVRPLSFRELKEAYPENQRLLDEYFIFGGMPFLARLKESSERRRYLRDLVQQIYLRDILERNSIRGDKGTLDALLRAIASSVGSLTSLRRLSNMFLSLEGKTILPGTVERYIDYFADSFLLEPAVRLDVKGNRHIAGLRKFYFMDPGLRNALLDFSEIEQAHALENIVYNELRSRGLDVRVGSLSADFRDSSGEIERKTLEIDFVATDGNGKAYIQCAYDLAGEGKREQEIRGLLRIKDGFRRLVVSRDIVVPRYDRNGILYVGLEDFLLGDYLGLPGD